MILKESYKQKLLINERFTIKFIVRNQVFIDFFTTLLYNKATFKGEEL